MSDRSWFLKLCESETDTAALIEQAIDRLAEVGPTPGRPLVDTLEHSELRNLKELRPGSRGRSEIRMLFVFDPDRAAIFLVAGDKAPTPERQAQARAELDAYVAGHHLKELRKAIGKTQAEVAQILGVSQSRISQIENGNLETMEGASTGVRGGIV